MTNVEPITPVADKFGVLRQVVELARAKANERVRKAKEEGAFTREAYVRFLLNQYHLTNGVQRALLRVAASARLAKKRKLRDFLFKFALDEEPHFLLAESDLKALGENTAPQPLESAIWWAYFNSTLDTEPFQRLGGTCILENIGVGLGEVLKPLFATKDFLRADTTRFLRIHLHEEIPHGDQVLGVLEEAHLEERDLDELLMGARIAAVIYLRMMEWYFDSDALVRTFRPIREIPHAPLPTVTPTVSQMTSIR